MFCSNFIPKTKNNKFFYKQPSAARCGCGSAGDAEAPACLMAQSSLNKQAILFLETLFFI
jgi:hypothetical protein